MFLKINARIHRQSLLIFYDNFRFYPFHSLMAPLWRPYKADRDRIKNLNHNRSKSMFEPSTLLCVGSIPLYHTAIVKHKRNPTVPLNLVLTSQFRPTQQWHGMSWRL